jgi:signal transduction histidine kinase
MIAGALPALPEHRPRGVRRIVALSGAIAFIALVTLPIRHLLPPLLPRSHIASVVIAVVMVSSAGLLRHRPQILFAVLLAEAFAVAVGVNDRQALPLVQLLAVDGALCFLAAARPRRVSITAAVVALGVLAANSALRLLTDRFTFAASSELAAALATAIAWMVGDIVRQRREYSEALSAQMAARAVMAERLRIAREVHDLVAHSIGIIAIQAGAGSRVINTQPAEAAQALRAIEATSRDTLAGLRRMLRALRRGEADPVPTAPAPGLADVGSLAATAADAGLSVDVAWGGERRQLAADIDLSAFRIVQEAVTNVVRHAEAQSCRISVDYGDDEVSIEVIDDGRGCGGVGTGYGIAGMRERVSLLHGQFSAGPRPEGGFRVAARLPG